MTFVNSFLSEWVKRKGSAASWLTLIGGLFIPVIITLVRLVQHTKTLQANSSDGVWNDLFNQCWQFMAILLLPAGIILATSLIAQIEYRNNTWKQLHTTPQSLSIIFWAKLSVVLVMLVQFFIVLNIGIYVAGIMPGIIYRDIPFPQQQFPFLYFLKGNFRFFLNCLPILALQYLLSLHIRNFMVPIGIGIGLMLASMIAVSWKYGYLLPYSYCSLQYIANDSRIDTSVNIHGWAAGYTFLFTAVNFILYSYKLDGNRIGIIKRSNFKKAALAGAVVFTVCTIASMLLRSSPASHLEDTSSLAVSQRIHQVENRIGFVKFKAKGQADTNIEERMRYYGINGLSIAVINNYKVEWAKGYGWADVNEKRPVTIETLFQPGSISKSLNAIGIAKLYQDKKLDLFRDVNDYLTSWKFPYDSISNGKKITLAQLLSHSAGLNVHGFGFTNYAREDTLPTVVDILNGQKPSTTDAVRSIFEPGWKYQYSGGGTMISQLVIMDVTTQPYDSYMRKHVLLPLGMKSSFFTQPPPAAKEKYLATGYTQVSNGKEVKGKYPVTPQQAAAGLWTTPTDLAKMVINIQESLNGNSASFLTNNTAELMLTPYNDDRAALGFFLEKRNDVDYFQHGAGNPGFAGWYYASKEKGRGVVICMNSDSHAEIFDEIIKAVAEVYNWNGFMKPEKPIERTVITLSRELANQYTGAYQLGSSMIIVQAKGNELWLNAQGRSWKMHFTSDTTFFNTESRSEKSFQRDKVNKVKSMIFIGQDEIKRIATRIEPVTLPEKWQQLYAGRYTELGGETATILLKENSLWLHSENAVAPMKLHFVSNTDFYIEENGGLFSFQKTGGGTVKSVTVKGEEDKSLLTRTK